jgi:hypothetical protein
MISLMSFLPRLRVPWSLPKKRIDDSDNLLFFGHIANYTVEGYLSALAKSFETGAAIPSKLEKYYAEQIIINSQISLYKFRCFTLGIWLTLSAFLTPLPPLVKLVVHIFSKGESR